MAREKQVNSLPADDASEVSASPSEKGVSVKVAFVNGVSCSFNLDQAQGVDLMGQIARAVSGKLKEHRPAADATIGGS